MVYIVLRGWYDLCPARKDSEARLFNGNRHLPEGVRNAVQCRHHGWGTQSARKQGHCWPSAGVMSPTGSGERRFTTRTCFRPAAKRQSVYQSWFEVGFLVEAPLWKLILDGSVVEATHACLAAAVKASFLLGTSSSRVAGSIPHVQGNARPDAVGRLHPGLPVVVIPNAAVERSHDHPAPILRVQHSGRSVYLR